MSSEPFQPNLASPEFPGFQNGGSHEGEYPVALWDVVDVHPFSVRNTMDYLNRVNRIPHIVWNPNTGDTIYCLSQDVAGRYYSKPVNRGGAPCIQIVVCCQVGHVQVSQMVCEGLRAILRALDDLGVPRVFPLGVPSPYGRSWGRIEVLPEPGHYAGNQIDPSLNGLGRMDVKRFLEGGDIGDRTDPK